MNRMRLVCWVAATLVIAACGSSGSTGGTNTSNAYAGKTITFAAALSILGAGGVYGPQRRDGALLAVKQINASGGVNGAMIDLEVQDEASLAATSAQKAQTMITACLDLDLLGPRLSNSAVSVHPLA